MICPQCGTPSREGDRFCEECGAALYGPDERSLSSTQVAARTGPTARLVPMEENGQGAYELANRAVVGRLDSCDLPINDRSVSREHARLSRLRDTYILEDLGSTNGTLVNGRRINESVILRAGDVVTFGSIEFRYETFPADASGTGDSGHGAEREEHSPTHTAAAPTAEDLPPVPVSFPPLEPFPTHPADVPPEQPTAEEQGRSQTEAVPLAADSASSSTPNAVTRLVAESRDATQKLLSLLDDLGTRLEENERIRGELEGQLQALAAGEAVREAARQAMRDVLPSTISQEQVSALQQVLAELAAHPRDVEVLLRVGNQASVLAAVVNELLQLRTVIDRVSSTLDGAPGPTSS